MKISSEEIRIDTTQNQQNELPAKSVYDIENKLYYEIAHQSTSGIYVIDKATYNLIYVNHKMCTSFDKFANKAWQGKKCYEVFVGKKNVCEDCVLNHQEADYQVHIEDKWYTVNSFDCQWNGIQASVIYINDQTVAKSTMDEIKQIYDNIPGAVFRCHFDEDWTVISANDGLFNFLGYTREEFEQMGNKMSAVIHPEDQAIMANVIIKQLAEGKTVVENVNRLICKDGSIRWISIKAQLLVDGSGKKFFYCVFVDITQEKEEEFLVNESKVKLSIAMEHASMLYWEYDIPNKLAVLNKMSQDVLKLPEILEDYPESYISKGMIYPDDIEKYRMNVAAITAGEAYREFEARIQRPMDNDYRWMKLRFTGIRDNNNVQHRAVCTAEVISDFKELEKRFQLIMEQNLIDTWIYDIPRHRILLDRDIQRISGFYQGQTIINNVPNVHLLDNFCHEDDADKLYELYKAVDAGQTNVTAVLRFWNTQYRAYRWERCTYTTVMDRAGKPIYAIGSLVDISEQVEAEQRYKAEMEYRTKIQQKNQLWSAHCNVTKNKILEATTSTESDLFNHYSKNREHFFHTLGERIVDPEKQKAFYDTFLRNQVVANYDVGNTNITFECGIYMDSESRDYRWISIQLSLVLEPVTKDLEGFLVITDHSEQKLQQYMLDAMLKDEYDFVAGVDMQTDKINVVVDNINEQDETRAGIRYNSYRQRYEYNLEHVVTAEKEKYRRIMSPEYISYVMNNQSTLEYTYRIKENKKIRAKRVSFFSYPEKRDFVIFSQTDVTEMLREQYKQQRTLAQSLKATEKASKAKTDFLSRMSHDMRTPLNAIMGLSALTLDAADKPEQVRENITKMNAASSFLLGLVNDILDMARIEEGKVELKQEHYCYHDFLTNLWTMFKPQCDAKDLELSFHKPQYNPEIITDKIRLNQIIFNVLSNSVKYTNAGGKITYEVKNFNIEGNQLQVDFVISDTGIGMSPEYLKQVYEPFVQEDNTVTSQLMGSGLGLSITKKLVELMGGRIKIESTKNVGTTVTIHMKFKVVNKNAPKSIEKTVYNDTTSLAGKTILLVEDHPINAQIACMLLEKKGINVISAANGRIAVEKFYSSPLNSIDGVLMDIRMPEMNGLEATKAIRHMSREDAATVPIIAMSANAYQEDVDKSLAAGMNEHLAKPVKPELLYDVLGKFLA